MAQQGAQHPPLTKVRGDLGERRIQVGKRVCRFKSCHDLQPPRKTEDSLGWLGNDGTLNRRRTAAGQTHLDFRYEETCSAEAGSASPLGSHRYPIANRSEAVTYNEIGHETPPMAMG